MLIKYQGIPYPSKTAVFDLPNEMRKVKNAI